MLCQNCGKNEATTHIKQVINGDTAERHLCSECAEHLGYGDAFSGFGFDVAGLFGNFFGDAVHSLGAREKWFAARNAALRSMISSERAESAARSATKFFITSSSPHSSAYTARFATAAR